MTVENKLLEANAHATEQMFLGMILLNYSLIYSLRQPINEEWFSDPAHKTIWTGAVLCEQKKRDVDPISVISTLAEIQRLDDAGGSEYISELSANASLGENHLDYVDILEEHYKRRRLAKLCDNGLDYLNSVKAGKHSIEEVLGHFENALYEIQLSSDVKGYRPKLIKEYVNSTDAILNSKEQRGLKIGFQGIDELTGGFKPGELIVIAGRPSMGKTTLAMNIACNILQNIPNNDLGEKLESHALFFSLEMRGEEVAMRLYSSLQKIHMTKLLHHNRMTTDDHAKAYAAGKQLQTMNLVLDDSPYHTVQSIRSKIKGYLAKNNVKFSVVFIDYLGLMRTPKQMETKNVEVTEICAGLKLMARELSLPVVVLSQLNRAVEQRENKRPFISDLRDSGSVEQDADIVMLLYRNSAYKAKSTLSLDELRKAEIIIAKNRNGATGTVNVDFIGEYSTFKEPD